MINSYFFNVSLFILEKTISHVNYLFDPLK